MPNSALIGQPYVMRAVPKKASQLSTAITQIIFENQEHRHDAPRRGLTLLLNSVSSRNLPAFGPPISLCRRRLGARNLKVVLRQFLLIYQPLPSLLVAASLCGSNVYLSSETKYSRGFFANGIRSHKFTMPIHLLADCGRTSMEVSTAAPALSGRALAVTNNSTTLEVFLNWRTASCVLRRVVLLGKPLSSSLLMTRKTQGSRSQATYPSRGCGWHWGGTFQLVQLTYLVRAIFRSLARGPNIKTSSTQRHSELKQTRQNQSPNC